ncbi:MAG: hypothetical protein F4Z32_02180, partial [Gemmatimonadetes bacterium]|nr:hypothetical protein [Gemmatimonadota bacterium]
MPYRPARAALRAAIPRPGTATSTRIHAVTAPAVPGTGTLPRIGAIAARRAFAATLLALACSPYPRPPATERGAVVDT